MIGRPSALCACSKIARVDGDSTVDMSIGCSPLPSDEGDEITIGEFFVKMGFRLGEARGETSLGGEIGTAAIFGR